MEKDPTINQDQFRDEARIQLIEKQLAAGDLPPNKLYELTKELAKLKGEDFPEAPAVDHEQ